jgi:hypothetical protein
MRTITRKEFMALTASAGAGSLLLGGLPPRRAAAHEGMPSYITNALEHQTYDMFTEWFSWLRRAGTKGYLGEHSVPNTQKPLAAEQVQKWLVHFDKVYRILDSNTDVMPAVTAHVASIYAGDVNGFQIYGPDRTDVPIRDRNFARAFAQAAVVESHPPVPGARRGVNTSSGAVTQFGFSRSLPGTYGRHYVYPDRADFAYLRGRGLNLARIPFRWERVQPRLNYPLKSAELARLKGCFDAAAAEGMKVIPNVHNYGYYALTAFNYQTIGSASVPISAFKDLWVRLAEAWKDHPAVVGYDIMNEPKDLPGMDPAKTWEHASQAAVDAIAQVDTSTRIWVSGYHTRAAGSYDGLYSFIANHPDPWIESAATFGYTTHCYYGPGAGYLNTYDEAVALWESKGY